jgi:hypothetical protein
MLKRLEYQAGQLLNVLENLQNERFSGSVYINTVAFGE